jgi:hypothetical protein
MSRVTTEMELRTLGVSSILCQNWSSLNSDSESLSLVKTANGRVVSPLQEQNLMTTAINVSLLQLIIATIIIYTYIYTYATLIKISYDYNTMIGVMYCILPKPQ